jgi:hypothetical protein
MLGLHIVLAFGVGTAMAAALAGGGARVRRWLRLPVRAGLRFPVDLLLGSWALAAVVLLLGLAHLWFSWVLVAATVALALVGRWRPGWRWSGLVPPLVGALVALPLALAEPFFYDALVYHLGLPWQALLEHGLHPHPEDLFAAFPPLAQLLAAPPLALGLDRAPAVLHWWSFVAAGCVVGALARALGAPRWSAAIAAAGLLLLPGDALVPGLPAAEGWAVAGVLAALAVALAGRPPKGGALLAGLMVGVASAARLQGVSWAVVVVAVVWARERRWRAGALTATGWLVGSAPWWVKNLLLLGDPSAPLLWRREGVQTLWRDAGALLSGAGPAEFARSLARALAPHATYLAPLALAALLALLAHRQRRLWLAAAAAAVGVLAWALTGSLPRFLAPTLGVVLALAATAARTPLGRWAAALALTVTVVTGLVFNVGQLQRLGGVTVAVRSAVSEQKWIPDNPLPGFVAARALPRDARVLFVGEPRGFLFPRRFVAPSQHDVSPLRSILETSHGPAAVAAGLRRLGFTHLLVNWGELARLTPSYPVAPWRDPAGLRRWNTFITSLGPPQVAAGVVQVFVLPSENRPGV